MLCKKFVKADKYWNKFLYKILRFKTNHFKIKTGKIQFCQHDCADDYIVLLYILLSISKRIFSSSEYLFQPCLLIFILQGKMYVQIEEKYAEDSRQEDVETPDTHSLGVRYKPQDLPFTQQVLAGTTNKRYGHQFSFNLLLFQLLKYWVKATFN